MAVRVGINGFGRIGRNVFRAARGADDLQIVAVNDVTAPATLAHLLRHDSVLGGYPGAVGLEGDRLQVDGRPVRVFAEREVGQVPWGELGVAIVLEASGRFTDATVARAHIDRGGAHTVIITAPATHEDLTVCLGVNQAAYDPERHRVLSNASCTTNCLAPVAKVLHETFGLEAGLMTAVHAYTNDQVLLDGPHPDLRRARAAGLSIIPTTTGAAQAIALVLPELAGRLHGYALRVPVANVSLVDLTATLTRPATEGAVNQALRSAAEGPLLGILGVSDEPLVSADFRGDPRSSIVDLASTMTVGDRLIKVLSWYDNEWGYSCRVVELARLVASRLPAAEPAAGR
ncbi:MAG TPA: type I glyceraldehyde-3-phosphate dehydrogenase [Candidatus Micrarchaeia archaeon]|nr:type I glyceraldehyde-3-phosphate dehydrogenase [Candidatus Micrarchaeia archaeon]